MAETSNSNIIPMTNGTGALQLPTLTKDDVATLTAPFDAGDHEFFKGRAYITEEAICTRIEEVDPAWNFAVINQVQRDDQFITTVRLTIKGVSRDGVGMGQTLMSKDGSREVNEPEKASATDALKRAARLFGIGRYLVGLERGVDYNEQTLRKWLENKFPKSKQPVTDGPWSTAERMVDFHTAIEKRFPGVTQAEIASAVGIKKYTDYAAWNKQFDNGQEAGTAVVAALQKAIDNNATPISQRELIDAPEADQSKAQYNESFS